MANPEHVEIAKQGATAINEWRIKNPARTLDLFQADLFGAGLYKADLSHANLGEANLWDANLGEANLNHANLSAANPYGAKLQGANLCNADLRWAKLMLANLHSANLSRANLSEANLTGANLIDTNLEGAWVEDTVFANIDLSQTIGLKAVRHLGPSEIGIQTLLKSQGEIPEEFLRGCGVPEDFITYLPSLIATMHPIQYQSCFISYSSRDEEFVRRLHEKMRAEKLRVWFAPVDMQGGRKSFEQIDRAIQVNDRLLLVLSEHSMNSEWVMTEIRRARKTEFREKRQKLFPIRLADMDQIREWTCFDADIGKDLAMEVREFHIPDFSNWKIHDAFESAFADLLRDLRNQA